MIFKAHFSPVSGMMAQGSGFTRDFTEVFCRVGIAHYCNLGGQCPPCLLCGFKYQVRKCPSADNCVFKAEIITSCVLYDQTSWRLPGVSRFYFAWHLCPAERIVHQYLQNGCPAHPAV